VLYDDHATQLMIQGQSLRVLPRNYHFAAGLWFFIGYAPVLAAPSLAFLALFARRFILRR
jgi:hypothetical protein